MSRAQPNRELAELERKAIAAEKKTTDDVASRSDRLEAAISAAELYMKALKIADLPNDKARLYRKTKQLIVQAEKLKDDERNASPILARTYIHPTSKRVLTTREKIILLESSKLNGTMFRQWTTNPDNQSFELKDVQELFVDLFEYSLSETQLKHFDGWQRPRIALSRIEIFKDGQMLPNEATMEKLGDWDLVQDVAPDCSVVASFCVGAARAEKGHKRLFGEIVYPYDYEADRPQESANGKYVLRLYFNGCWRQVEIDDRLPTSKSSRVLHTIDRSHPGLLWPAIAEKAYLKVRGGYNFPGSNSGTDLAVLTGWIPQQVFLHDEEVEPEDLWEEILSAFNEGHVLCTLGTGKLGHREQRLLGLGAEHDYAVLEMQASGDLKEMLIKNPWAEGDIWKGATRCRPHPGHENDVPQSAVSTPEIQTMKPGTFWMDFNHVFQYFEHMYLNWDPCLFSHREDMHFTWHLPDNLPAGNLFVDNPQFAVKARNACTVWILLNRHFRTGDYSVQNHGSNGYISLYLFNNHGQRVFSSETARIRGPFVDSPNTLLRFEAQAGEVYTIVAVNQDLPVGKHNFTISAFATTPVELRPAFNIYKQPQSLSLSWTRATAGGNADSPTYLQNPQIALTLTKEAQTTIVLQTVREGVQQSNATDVHVKLLVATSDGKRTTKLRQRDTKTQSGNYKRGATVIETLLPKGMYTIICSSFEAGQLAKFRLDCYTTLEAHETIFKSLPAEGSGRLQLRTGPAVFTGSVSKLIAPLRVSRTTKVLCKAWQARGTSSLSCKMSLEQGQGPYRRCIATSSTADAEFTSSTSGLRIEDLDLNTTLAAPAAGGLWLVVERAAQTSTVMSEDIVLQIELLSEEKVEVGAWAPLED